MADVSRGAAFGDLDNDGDIDVVVGTASGPARVLINNAGNRNRWLGLRLEGRHGLGARVAVVRASGPVLWRRARADGSYASANDPRVIVGLGGDAGPVMVRVQWTNGDTDEWTNVAVDRWMTLREGEGR
ncbi:MAG: hypothetical protein FJW14_06955 [Acidimicrobiia bacterium]|nr:hypothetical protein [Acidimicrobiia bacterium]